MTIIEPSQSSNKTDADAAWEKETTNAINALQNQIQNLGSGVVSGNNRILVYATDAAGSDMSYEQKSLSGFSAVLSYSGELPTLPVSGLVFSPFSDTVVNTTIKQYIRTTTVQTSAPPAVGTYNTRTGEWSKSVGWQKTIPQADNVPTWVCHAVISGSGNVAINWTNPTLFYSNNRATGKVYYTEPQQATPSKPTATDFNFSTFVISFGAMESGAANKWQQQPFTYDVTNTVKKQYVCEYIAEKHPGSTTATVTFGAPLGYVGIADDLISNNYNGNIPVDLSNAGSAGWAIARATGNAVFNNVKVRGQLNASDLTAGTLSVDRIGTNAIGMTKITTNIQSSNYSSGSSGWRIQQSGAAEFNAPVISRNLVLASFTDNAANFYSSGNATSTIANVRTYYIESTSVGLGTWGGTSETLMATAQLDATAEVHYTNGQQPFWGVTADILPLARLTGQNQSLRLRIRYWGKFFWGITTAHVSGTTHNVNIKIYKVT